jgi:fermentation-respiration switch protein FrsA (DUF1100 family)
MIGSAGSVRGRLRAVGLFVLRWATLIGILYAGVVLVFWLLERSLVFHPSLATEAWQAPVAPSTQDVELAIDDGCPIHMWWLPPADPGGGAFLVAHGNGGNLSHRGQLAADLNRWTRAGVLLFDYPGYGRCGGSPTEKGCYEAGEGAYRWLLEQAKVPANRIVFFGESLGGGVAVELATRHDHRALVLLYTFTSLPAAAKYHYPWLPTFTFMRSRFDNLAKIGGCHRPVFIAHGTADRVVPFAHGEALFAAANEPKEFLRLEGAGHSLDESPGFHPSLARFLSERAP